MRVGGEIHVRDNGGETGCGGLSGVGGTVWSFFFFKRKRAYEIKSGLGGWEMCIRDSVITAIPPPPYRRERLINFDAFRVWSKFLYLFLLHI